MPGIPLFCPLTRPWHAQSARSGEGYGSTGSPGSDTHESPLSAHHDEHDADISRLIGQINASREVAASGRPLSFQETVQVYTHHVEGAAAPVSFSGSVPGKIAWIQPSGPRKPGEGSLQSHTPAPCLPPFPWAFM